MKDYERIIDLLYPLQLDVINHLGQWYKNLYRECKIKGISPDNKYPLLVEPTGFGKTIIISTLIARRIANKSKKRVLVITHREELVQQNHDTFIQLHPGFSDKTGIACNGLGQNTLNAQVVFSMIHTISSKKNINNLEAFDTILIDEAHMVDNQDTLYKGKKSQYRKVLERLKKKNKNVYVVGLTATPYRLGEGAIYGNKRSFFHSIAHETNIGLLFQEGYLTPIVTPKIDSHLLMKYKRDKNNNKDLNAQQRDEAINSVSLEQQLQLVVDFKNNQKRKSILIFCATIDHAKQTAKILTKLGIGNESIYTGSDNRAKHIRRFKAMELTCLINVDVLTVGFDCREIDMLVMLRPTKSIVLFIQMLGRGMRKFLLNKRKKENKCLLLDFAGNTDNFPSINDINWDRYIDKEKKCPVCGNICHSNDCKCKNCKHIFKETEEMNSSGGGDRRWGDSKLPTCDNPVTNNIKKTKYLNNNEKEYSIDKIGITRAISKNDLEYSKIIYYQDGEEVGFDALFPFGFTRVLDTVKALGAPILNKETQKPLFIENIKDIEKAMLGIPRKNIFLFDETEIRIELRKNAKVSFKKNGRFYNISKINDQNLKRATS